VRLTICVAKQSKANNRCYGEKLGEKANRQVDIMLHKNEGGNASNSCGGFLYIFWHDPWCGEVILKEAFPVLFKINWLIQDWELEILQSFLDLLYSSKIRRDGEDQVCWIPTKSNVIEVKSYYKVLSNEFLHFFSWKSIWRVKAPTKVAFFTWATARGKILPSKEIFLNCTVVLHVQEKWGVLRSLAPSL
jgi:hypothetical protein